jgi:hypothetical protein
MKDFKGSGKWIGVDFDRTLAFCDKHRGLDHTGEPIPTMVARVKLWVSEGKDVRIFTARISHDGTSERIGDVEVGRRALETWMDTHLGFRLPLTNVKDWLMEELWDDRATQVVANIGITYDELLHGVSTDQAKLVLEINRLTRENCQLRHEIKHLKEGSK